MTETEGAYHESLWLKFKGVFWETGLPVPGQWYQDFRCWRDVVAIPWLAGMRPVRYATYQASQTTVKLLCDAILRRERELHPGRGRPLRVIDGGKQ